MKRPRPDNLQSILPINEKKEIILNFKKNICLQSIHGYSEPGVAIFIPWDAHMRRQLSVGYLCHPVLMDLPPDKCHVRRDHHVVHGDAGHIVNPR